MSPHEWTAREIREAVAAGRVSATEICQSCLSRIDDLDRELGAFLHVDHDRVAARARDIDQWPAERRAALPLCGVPIAVKDVICVSGAPATAGSKTLETFVPPYNATVIARLQAAGAIVIGKTNCDEFAMGSSTENSAYRVTRNPWRRDAIPGGSSGGSAVAVGARMAPVALGTDTGGSVRQPAALCGVVGLKPTYGRVSRYGLIAFASSLDQIGPFSRTAHDAALVLTAIAGADPQDSTAAPEEVPDFAAALTGDVRGLTIGVPRTLLDQGVDPDILRSFDAALETLRGLGVTLTDIQLPHAQYAIPTYYLVATAEASSNLARYDGVRYGFRAPADAGTDLRRMYERTRAQGFGAEVKRRIMLGTYVLSAGYYDAYYLKAQKVRTLIRQDYVQAFERVDIVAMPTSPTPAFRIGERVNDPLQMYLADVFTVGVNLAGLPGISVPCGFTRDGLPAGLQLVGRMFDEATLLRAADAYERVTEWWKAEPAVSLSSGGPG
ncbi:MAG: Asp-tRNA(Asn)/Glu-tRNA(Gln) amidotransferase subunit GatA [Acidobacteria bacterium]|nr:Asp-tRNA(Asn)/Glu-tRNA(Gln) amidotransferase subunit GatA [Acidobacteriota bacterium]MBI3263788.1 Asp-tRNA(Asn)/Glu-tRNA(Gln) amidotransferase subunit GatA [Acidobacteriota bacterium]